MLLDIRAFLPQIQASTRLMRNIILTTTILCSLTASTPAAPVPDWVQRSNTNAAILLQIIAKYSPEAASRFGV